MSVSVVEGPHNLVEDSRGRLDRFATLLARCQVVAHGDADVSLLCFPLELHSAHSVGVSGVVFTDVHDVALPHMKLHAPFCGPGCEPVHCPAWPAAPPHPRPS